MTASLPIHDQIGVEAGRENAVVDCALDQPSDYRATRQCEIGDERLG